MRGGSRPNAGRKKGSLTKRTQELVAAAGIEGVQPAEVLIQTMRHYWAKGEWDKAVAVAKEAAPYFHPKLASIEQQTTATVEQTITVKQDAADEIDRRIARIAERAPEEKGSHRH